MTKIIKTILIISTLLLTNLHQVKAENNVDLKYNVNVQEEKTQVPLVQKENTTVNVSEYATKNNTAEAKIVKNVDENNQNILTNGVATKKEFITIQTKSGKQLHLYIDRENNKVLLTTEVSEQDLLNMVDVDKLQKHRENTPSTNNNSENTTQTTQVLEETKEISTPIKFIMVIAVIIVIGGIIFYRKIRKMKEEQGVLEDEDY